MSTDNDTLYREYVGISDPNLQEIQQKMATTAANQDLLNKASTQDGGRVHKRIRKRKRHTKKKTMKQRKSRQKKYKKKTRKQTKRHTRKSYKNKKIKTKK